MKNKITYDGIGSYIIFNFYDNLKPNPYAVGETTTNPVDQSSKMMYEGTYMVNTIIQGINYIYADPDNESMMLPNLLYVMLAQRIA